MRRLALHWKAIFVLALSPGLSFPILSDPEQIDKVGLESFQQGLRYEQAESADWEQAARFYQQAADRHYAPAQFRLGLLYLEGKGVNRDLEKASMFIHLAATQGHPDALLLYGDLLRDGKGVSRNLQKAASFYERAADKGVSEANLRLAHLFKEPEQLERDDQVAARFYERAAAEGNLEALVWLGQYYDQEQGDLDKAKEYFSIAAEKQSSEAQYWMGIHYIRGTWGFDQAERGVEYLQEAAHKGVIAAQEQLGAVYFQGEFVQRDYAEALSLWKKAAEQGSAYASVRLGDMYFQGVGEKVDYSLAVAYYRSAARMDYPLGQVGLGVAYYSGKGVEQADSKEAFRLFQLAASQGNAQGFYWLGKCYVEGAGVESSPTRAFEAFTRAYESGEKEALWYLGRMHLYGEGVRQDVAQGLELLTLSASGENPFAQLLLAKAYYEGEHVDKDNNQAFYWVEKAIYHDLDEAYTLLGMFYIQGVGVEVNYEKGRDLLQVAAERGEAKAQYHYGQALALGIGGARDYESAAFYLESAALKGMHEAQNALGDLYLSGMGVSQDYDTAKKWFAEASLRGNARAQVNLGKMYLEGIGGFQSYTQAFSFFQKAAEAHDPEAQFFLGMLYLHGEGVTRAPKQAAFFLKQAVEQEFVSAYILLAKMYESGEGVPQDFEKAFTLYSKGIAQDHPEGVLGAARLIIYNGVEHDLGSIQTALQELVQEGNPEALYLYGVHFLERHEEETGVILLQQAADLDYPLSYLQLAKFYESKDPKQAIYYYEQARRYELQQALLPLAKLYLLVDLEGRAEEAAQLLKQAVEFERSDESLFYLGKLYADGKGVEKHYGKAESLLQESLSLGYARAGYQLGLLNLDPNNSKASPEKSIQYLQQAAEGGHVSARVLLGSLYIQNEFLEEGQHHLEVAIQEGSAEAAYILGESLAKVESSLFSPSQAVENFKIAAERGHVKAKEKLGFLYLEGALIEQDLALSLEYFLSAEKAGSERVTFPIGMAYFEGKGVAQDYTKALNYLSHAYKSGVVDAAYPLGMAYHALGNPDQAIQYISLAADEGHLPALRYLVQFYHEAGQPSHELFYLDRLAENGDPDALFEVGMRYYSGRGVAKDMEMSASYFSRAAHAGLPKAQLYTAKLYMKGVGVPKNVEKAIHYFQQAADAGDIEACHQLAMIYQSSKLGYTDVKKAVNYLEQARQMGGGQQAAEDLAELYYELGSVEQALSLWEGLASNKSIHANARLGAHYAKVGEKQKALPFLRRAAKKGHAEALLHLGSLLLSSPGVSDEELLEGVDYYKQALQKGRLEALPKLYTFYVERKEYKAALPYLLQASKNQDKVAFTLLGHVYLGSGEIPSNDEQAFAYFKTASSLGSTDADVELAKLYLEGRGCTQSLSHAVDHLLVAADQNNYSAQNMLGELVLQYPEQRLLDAEQFKSLFKEAQSDGNPSASYYLGIYAYQHGNFTEAVSFLRQSLLSEDYNAALPLAACYSVLGKSKKEVETLQLLADRKDPEALMALGKMYLEGEKVSQDLIQSLKYYLLAFDQGEESSALPIATIYQQKDDWVHALPFYQKASENGALKAHQVLGDYYYRNGEIQKSLAYLFRASERGDGLSSYRIGKILLDGTAGEIDEKQAIVYLQRAWQQRESRAAFRLGQYYQQSDSQAALHYFHLAADEGLEEAQEHLANDYLNKQQYKEALPLLEQLANKQKREALYILGQLYHKGKLGEVNLEKAVAFYEQAAKAGKSLAYMQLGHINLKKGIYEEAIPYFQKAAAAGELNALKFLGRFYTSKGEFKAAADYFNLAIEQGDTWSHYYLGVLYAKGELGEKDIENALFHFSYAQHENSRALLWIATLYQAKGDQQQALEYFTKAAQAGEIQAEIFLSKHYLYNGKPKAALYFLERAAKKGNLYAQYQAGRLYAEGVGGVEANAEKAFLYLSSAESRGHGPAAYLLGHLYEKERQEESAYYYYAKAADRSVPEAQLRMGSLAYKEKNYSKAAFYLEPASAKLFPEACYKLALMYLNGLGVEVDIDKALTILHAAEEVDNGSIYELLGRIYFKRGEVERGLGYFAHAADRNRLQSLAFLANYYRIHGEYTSSLEYFRRLQALDFSLERSVVVANLYVKAGDISQAVEELQQAHSQAYEPASVKLAELLFSTGRTDQAVLCLQEAMLSGGLQARKILGMHYLENNVYDQALTILSPLVAEGDEEAQLEVGKLLLMSKDALERTEGESLLRVIHLQGNKYASLALGAYYAQSGDTEAALPYYSAASSIGNIEATLFLADYFYAHAFYSKAERFFVKAASLGSDEAKLRLGVLYLQGDKLEQDLVLAKRYLEAIENSSSVETIESLALVHRELGDSKSFVRLMKQAASLYSPDALRHLGRYYHGLGEDIAAVEYWQELISKYEDPEATYRLGAFYLQESSSEDTRELALQYLDKALDAGQAPAGLLLGELYEQMEEYSQAIRYYTRVEKLGEHVYMPLANLYGKLGNNEKRVHYLEKAVGQGNMLAQRMLGDHYASSSSEDYDLELAANYYKLAADQGDVHSKLVLSRLYSEGQGVPKDQEVAVGYLKQAAMQKNAEALLLLAKDVMQGNNLDKDIGKAVDLLQQAVEQGSQEALLELGLAFAEQGNEQKAIQWLEKAGEKGFPEAFYKIGSIYLNKRSVAQGVEYLKLAAEQKHIKACYDLGRLYAEGKVVVKDEPKAIDYLKQASRSGSGEASYYLGQVVKKTSLKEAIHWYEVAINQGHPEAPTEVGNIYFVKKAYLQAIPFYQVGSQRKSLSSIVQLGRSYLYGYGVEKSLKKAHTLLMAAHREGRAEATYLLAKLFMQAEQEASSLYFFEQAANKGFTKAQRYLVNYYMQAKRYQEAIPYLMGLAARGDKQAHLYLGYHYLRGFGVEKNLRRAMKHLFLAEESNPWVSLYVGEVFKQLGEPDRSLRYYDLAAKGGIVFAQRALGDYYLENQQPQEAARYYLMASEQGNVYATYMVGILLYKGEGVTKDLHKAIRYLKYAEKNGIPTASYYIGHAHYNLKQYEESEAHLEKAAKAKIVESYKPLAQLYFSRGEYKRALHYYNMLAEQEDVKSALQAAKIYGEGLGVRTNVEKAAYFYRIAADGGSSQAQLMIGLRYLKGEGVPWNEELAIHYLELSASQENHQAQYHLGMTYFQKRAFEEAREYLEPLAKVGDSRTYMAMADIYLATGEESQALGYMEKAARNGELEALDYMIAHARSIGDVELEITLYKKGLEVGLGSASYALAHAYLEGRGVEQDEQEAISLFYRSAEEGFSLAFVDLAKIYHQRGDFQKASENYLIAIDRSVEEAYFSSAGFFYEQKQYSRSLQLYRLAAKEGDAEASYRAAQFYLRGVGAPADNEVAADYLRQAASSGHARALLQLGLMYKQGLGVAKDAEQAMFYFQEALEKGSKKAKLHLGILLGTEESLKNLPKAVKLLEESQNHQPSTWALLGQLYDELGKDKVAQKYYQKAAEQGNAYALNILAQQAWAGGKKHEALRFMRQLADQGHTQIQLLLGMYYLGHWGDEIEQEDALTYLGLAARGGHPQAHRLLGEMFYEGRLVEEDRAKSFQHLEQARDVLKPKSMYYLASLYMERDAGENERKRAYRYFRQAAYHGNVHAQEWLGQAYLYGEGVEQSDLQALFYLKMAADGGLASAQYAVGSQLIQTGEDVEKGVQYLDLASQQDHGKATEKLGLLYLKGELVAQDKDRALAYLERAARQNQPQAQVTLGSLLLDREEKGEYAKAVALFESASQQGNAEAKYLLAEMLYYGQGIESNQDLSAKYYEQAAEQGVAQAFYRLGEMYDAGTGRPQSEEKARTYFEEAADRGVSAACLWLGSYYQSQGDDAHSLSRSFKYYEQAKEAGEPVAFYQLAEIYRLGKGVARDLERAFSLYKEAGQKSYPDASLGIANLGETSYREALKKIGEQKELSEEHLKLLDLASQCGHLEASKRLATGYLLGVGVPQNDRKGFLYTARAARTKDLESVIQLGDLYRKGKGVESSNSKAEKIYRYASVQGSAVASYKLGALLETQGRKEAVDAVLQAVSANYPPAYALLGTIYREGWIIERNLDRSLHYFKQGADLNDPSCQYNLALMFLYGEGVSRDSTLAIQYFEEAADNGHVPAQAALGGLFADESRSDFDPERAEKILKRAIAQGSQTAKSYLAKFYFEVDGSMAALEKSKSLLSDLDIEQSDIAAYTLGRMYYEGKGVDRDQEKAYDLLEKAAANGNPQSQYYLAKVLSDATTGKPSEKALRYYKMAMHSKYLPATRALASIYLSEPTDVIDDPLSIHLFHSAAEAGDLQSQLFLIEYYQERGDRDATWKYLEAAAGQGHTEAMHVAGVAVLEGTFGPKPIDRGIFWLEKSAQQGSGQAAYDLANYLMDNWNYTSDKAKAFSLYKMALAEGIEAAATPLARMLIEGNGIEASVEKAVPYLIQSAALESAYSQHVLGTLYYEGLSVPQDQVKGYTLLEKAAEQGYAESQAFLAEMILNEKVAGASTEVAISYLREAANSGFARAQYLIGRMLYHGENVDKDRKEAAHYLLKAADQGVIEAQVLAGKMYHEGDSVAQNLPTAELYLRLAAEQGSIEAYYQLAKMISMGEISHPHRETESLKYLLLAAQGGLSSAEYILGKSYLYGVGVGQDYLKAANYFERVASKGHPEGKAFLGEMYLQGTGVVQNFNRSYELLQQAAEQGVVRAMRHVGDFYLHGHVVQRDASVAFTWYRKASEKGDAAASYRMAQLLERGLGTERDLQKALALYQEAASKGLDLAQERMGRHYQEVENWQEAIRYYSLSASNGLASAQVALGEIFYQGPAQYIDHHKAEVLFQEASQTDSAKALFLLGKLMLEKEGEDTKAMQLIRRSASLGYVPATEVLADGYDHGRYGIQADRSQALYYYQQAAREGSAKSYTWLAEYFMGMDDLGTKQRAQVYLSRALVAKEPRAQVLVARRYLFGFGGVRRNYSKAVSLLNEAYNAGNIEAARYLSECYEKGYGVSKDLEKAYQLMSAAAKKSPEEYLVPWAKLLRSMGRGEEAIEHLMVLQSDAKALNTLGLLLIDRGFAEDAPAAYFAFEKAASLGLREAELNLGISYILERGCEQDYHKGYKIFTKLADQGDVEAYKLLARLHFMPGNPYQDYLAAYYNLQKVWEASPSQEVAETLALIHYFGFGVQKNPARAAQILSEVQKPLSPESHYIMASLAMGQGVDEENRPMIYQQLKYAAAQGVAFAYVKLGELLLNDPHVATEEKVPFLHEAAEQGHLASQEFLGEYYLSLDRTKEAEKYLEVAASRGSQKALRPLAKQLLLEKKDLKASYPILKQFVRSEDAESCYLLGEWYLQRQSSAKDLNLAGKYFYKAQKLGYPINNAFDRLEQLAFEIGRALMEQNPSRADYTEASGWFMVAARAGNAWAIRWMASYYNEGLGVEPQDTSKAVQYYEVLAQRGDRYAQERLLDLLIFEKSGVKDYQKAYPYLQAEASEGNRRAMWELAQLDLLSASKDQHERALRYLDLLGQAKQAEAYTLLGNLYQSGHVVKRDDQKAFSYFKMAADLGDARAQDLAGFRYAYGIGVERDLPLAIHYLKLAAEQNIPSSMELLAKVYLGEFDFAEDLQQAYSYLIQAHTQGSRLAAYYLGKEQLPDGRFETDASKAKELLEEALSAGYQAARQMLAKLYYYGWGGEKNLNLAHQYLVQDYSDLTPEGQFILSQLLMMKSEAFSSPNEGRKLLVESANAKYGLAQLELGRVLLEEKQSQAESYLKQASAQGLVEADWLLAQLSGEEEGESYLLRSARGGWPKAKLDLAKRFLEEEQSPSEVNLGEGELKGMIEELSTDYPLQSTYLKGLYHLRVEKDPQTALALLVEAANEGLSQAQLIAGKLLYEGRSEEDAKQAVSFWRQALDEGSVAASWLLAEAYNKGKGVVEDKALALKLYLSLPAEQYPTASLRIGELYYLGSGASPHYANAKQAFEMAASLGEKDAFRWLGILHYFGQGVSKDYVQAYQYFQKGADIGDAEAQNWLAVCYYEGLGVQKDMQQAKLWFEKASAQGVTRAKFWLGMMAYDGDGQEENLDMARQYFEEASLAGDLEALYWLALMDYRGEGGKQDYIRARERFAQAAAQGHQESLPWLGLMLKEGIGGDKNLKQAMQVFEQASAFGDHSSMYWAGMIARNPEVNLPEKAVHYLSLAAENGHTQAYIELANMYHDGEGVEKNYTQAAQLFTKAAEQGDTYSQRSLADLYRLGRGVEQNDEKALHYYTLAADHGDRDSQAWLGNYYYLGGFYYGVSGGRKDYRKAHHYLTQAAEQGHARAQNYLGEMYYYGKGVRRNLRKASYYFDRAAAQGNSEAKNNLKQLSLR